MEYTIVVTRDEDANVWIAKNSELPIVLEDESLAHLMERVKEAAPEIAKENNLQAPSALHFVDSQYLTKIEKGFAQIEAGGGSKHDLIDVDDE